MTCPPDHDELELAAKIVHVLFAFKMRVDLVEENKLRAGCRDLTAETGQVVQLSECSREGRLAALVGTRDDDNAFIAWQ